MNKSNSPWRNPWIIGWMGLLIAFVMANAFMIYLTTGGGPGLVVDDYYERGEDYEKNMLKRLAQDPGWKMELRAPEPIEMGKKHIINVALVDAENKPLNEDSVMFHVYRPSDASKDFSLPLQRIDDGLYEVAVSFPLPGVWDVLVTVPFKDHEINFPQRIEVEKR